jgi:hypothetical protein
VSPLAGAPLTYARVSRARFVEALIRSKLKASAVSVPSTSE